MDTRTIAILALVIALALGVILFVLRSARDSRFRGVGSVESWPCGQQSRPESGYTPTRAQRDEATHTCGKRDRLRGQFCRISAPLPGRDVTKGQERSRRWFPAKNEESTPVRS
jgi:hypothetical protein